MQNRRFQMLKDYDVPYVLKTIDPTASDTGYSVPTDWINTTSKTSFKYMGAGVWKQNTFYGDALPTITSTDPATNAAVSTAIVDAYSGVVITLSAPGNAQTIQNPTTTTAGKKFWAINDDSSTDNITVNSIVLVPGKAQAYLWDGDAWVVATGIDADDITFTPTGDIVATNVQAAIAEVDTEKAIKGVNNDITSMTGLDDDGIPGAKVVAATLTTEGVGEILTDAEIKTGTEEGAKFPSAKGLADNYRKATVGINLIGIPNTAGFGVGICPPQLLPNGMISLPGFEDPLADNYGNYMFREGSIDCWVPIHFVRIGHADNPTYAAYGVNSVDIKGLDTYATEALANADGYALPRAFIDGGIIQQGFFYDKYMCSKNAWGSGQIASSIKNGLPLSTAAAHNPIADLTACAGNFYYEAIKAAHARDGVNGAENANSIFHCASRFQQAALAILSLAHAQASSSTAFCAWYDATYNYPKGCNNNALRDYDEVSLGAGSGDNLLYVTDMYSACGKTGSGIPFAKSTHNGQNCGIADVNGLMYEINIGATCIVPAAAAIEAMSQASPCQITWTGHGLTTDAYTMILGITQADWSGCKDKLWQVTRIDDNNFTIAFNASGFGTPYDAGTDPGTVTKGTFYVAKEATAMKDFDSGNAGATDHWGATGVAAMMDAFTPAFESGGAFAQRFGSGANQVLSEAMSGNAWLLTGLGFPKDADGVDTTGTNQFGKDYYYQYIRNELCVLSCGLWSHVSSAGVWSVHLHFYRPNGNVYVGFRSACYPE